MFSEVHFDNRQLLLMRPSRFKTKTMRLQLGDESYSAPSVHQTQQVRIVKGCCHHYKLETKHVSSRVRDAPLYQSCSFLTMFKRRGGVKSMFKKNCRIRNNSPEIVCQMFKRGRGQRRFEQFKKELQDWCRGASLSAQCTSSASKLAKLLVTNGLRPCAVLVIDPDDLSNFLLHLSSEELSAYKAPIVLQSEYFFDQMAPD